MRVTIARWSAGVKIDKKIPDCKNHVAMMGSGRKFLPSDGTSPGQQWPGFLLRVFMVESRGMRRLLLVPAILLSGCYSDRIAKLESDNKELRSQLDKQKQTADLDTQAKCSTAAKAFFRDNWNRDKGTMLLDYSNHYNRKLSKCFIVVEWHYSDPITNRGEWFNNIQLYDVFENNRYAELSEHIGVDPKTFAAAHRVLRCDVQGTECKTSEDFNSQIGDYLSK
jgi:hypothetical protein